jgi:hypothetical protein
MIEDAEDAPVEADAPQERGSSRAWLARIKQAEKAFEDYQNRADNIDKLFADLSSLANNTRDRKFQLFWANIQVLGPAIYSRTPVPVVVPKFKDRDRVKGTASELLERCTVASFDVADINSLMMLIRDDLSIQSRGVARLRYETSGESFTETEKVCFEHIDRKDFLHEPARNWREVGWVAFRAWLTKAEMRKRFRKHSKDAYQDADYSVQKDDRDRGAADKSLKCGVWEIWSKTDNRVVWVANGVEVFLDDDEPHLKLEQFFPCPRPAYGTTQRRSLIPVPDVLQYKDQLEEINDLTARIHALSDAIKVRGFYPAGAGEIGDAIESALKSNDDRQVMIPISNWAAFGGGGAKDTIVWLPLDQIAATVQVLVDLRRQVMSDVYEIVGLSDIMRGSTDPDETKGAQQLKAQFGSVRIRDRQSELVRIARDMVRISAEIMAENFDPDTLFSMAQMQLPAQADIEKQMQAVSDQADKQFEAMAGQIQQEAQQGGPEAAQAAQQKLQQVQQQIVSQAQMQLDKLKSQVTREQVIELISDQKVRPFVFDIETDSTIQADEDAEKQRRTEFVGMLGTVLRQLGEMVANEPTSAKFAAEVLKFSVAPFRAGRGLDQSIDEFADGMIQKYAGGKQDPEADKAKAEAEAEDRRSQAEMQMKQMELQARMQKLESDQQAKMMDAELKREDHAAKIAQLQAQLQRDAQKHNQEIQKLHMEIGAKQQELQIKQQGAQIDAATKMQQAQLSADAAQQKAMQNEQAFQQKSALQAQKPISP